MVLLTIVAVLSTEEQVLGLRQPSGVGARPRPMATELCNQTETTTKPVPSLPESTWADMSCISDISFDTNSCSMLKAKQQMPQSFKQLPDFQRIGPNSLSNCFAGGDSSHLSPVRGSESVNAQKMIPTLWSNSIANSEVRNEMMSSRNQVSGLTVFSLFKL